MSSGIVICSICRREAHQDGPRKHTDGCRCASNDTGYCRAGWTHCEDKTPTCDGAEIVYPPTIDRIRGRYCGMDRS